MNLFVTDAPCV